MSLDTVRGTGPGGRVAAADVTAAAERHERAVPARMPVPVTSVMEVDLTRIVRTDHDTGTSRQPASEATITAVIAKAALEALRMFPMLASVAVDGRAVVHPAEQHLGVAVDTDRGPLVPVVRRAGDLNAAGLSRRIAELGARARSGSLTPDELSGATFTLADTSDRGTLFDTPVLVPGQVAILGTGAIRERPAVVRLPGGERAVAVRSIGYLALTYDHRAVDGVCAARFLTCVKDRLEGAGPHTVPD